MSFSFPTISELKSIQAKMEEYAEVKNHIIRQRKKVFVHYFTQSFFCLNKNDSDIKCQFFLSYKICEDNNQTQIAILQEEKSFFGHSEKCCAQKELKIDRENLRKGFKLIEKDFINILKINNKIKPKQILETLIEENQICEKMSKLKEKYPKRFKKCLDNQVNKHKRSLKKENSSNSDSLTLDTLLLNETNTNFSNSFISDETKILQSFLRDSNSLLDEEEEFSGNIIFY